MLTKSELSRLYETLLSIPGMNDPVRMDLKIPRKNVLVLNQVIRRGLAHAGEGSDGSLLELTPPEALEEMERLAGELLNKAGLTQMQEKLEAFDHSE